MITAAYTKFFSELEKNNNKEWFHEHKSDYELAKKQFIGLIESILPTLRNWEPQIDPDPKKALFRINKDTRFSKDKSPYHTIMKAGFSADGKKSLLPGYYLGLSTEKIHVGGGLFNVNPDTLKSVRELILADPHTLKEIVNQAEFKKQFGELQGEKAKRIDTAFMDIAESSPWIMHKQFYAMHETKLTPAHFQKDLSPLIIEKFEAIHPLVNYLMSAFRQ